MSERIVPQDFYVYVHRKATTGEVFYVGKGFGRRAWSTHRSKYWHNISKKHGFCVEIVKSGLQEWYSFELECQLIALYGRDVLCNMTDGGEGTTGAKGRVFTHEQRQKLSLANKGKVISQEQRHKISKTLKGKPFTMERKIRLNLPETKEKHRIAVSLAKKGKPLSDQAKQAISRAKQGRKFSPDHCAAIKKALNNTETKDIRRLSMSKALANPQVQQKRRIATGAKKILCVESGRIFETSYCAEKWLRQTNPRAARQNVLSACAGKLRTAYGYTWQYA
jgi:hypothetical protein